MRVTVNGEPREITSASVNALLEVINRIELAQRTARTSATGITRIGERVSQTAV